MNITDKGASSYNENCYDMADKDAVIARQNARIAELEAALKPFADEAEATSIRAEFYDIVNCYAGHLRAARAALEKKND